MKGKKKRASSISSLDAQWEKLKATALRVKAERDALLAAAKAVRDGWEHNLTEPMALLNAAIDQAEKP